MALNKVSAIWDSYVVSPGFPTVTQVTGGHPNVRPVSGEAQLLADGSSELFGVCVDNSGNIFASDPIKHVIIMIKPNGATSLYAGTPSTSGNDGATPKRLHSAKFNTPRGLAVDASGALIVADSGNNQIKRITPDGWVTLLAGDPAGTGGYVNGTSARFSSPWDVAVDASNNIYIADYANHCIRLIRNGVATVYTFVGTNVAGDVNGVGNIARFRNPRSVTVDASGMVFVGDYGNYKVKRVSPNGAVYSYCGAGTKGTTAGAPSVAKFQDIMTVTNDRSGNVYVLDYAEGTGARLVRLNQDGYNYVIYNFLTVASQPKVVGVDVNRSGRLFIIESNYEDRFYSSSSSSSNSSSSRSTDSSNSSSTWAKSSSSSSSLSTASSDSSSLSSDSSGDSGSSAST